MFKYFSSSMRCDTEMMLDFKFKLLSRMERGGSYFTTVKCVQKFTVRRRWRYLQICRSVRCNEARIWWVINSRVPRNFVRRWGGSTNSVEDRGQRERESGTVSLLVRGSGVSCNLVQEISFHIVKFS